MRCPAPARWWLRYRRRHGDGADTRAASPASWCSPERTAGSTAHLRARRSFAGRASWRCSHRRRRERAAHPVGIGAARRRSCRRRGKAVRRRLRRPARARGSRSSATVPHRRAPAASWMPSARYRDRDQLRSRGNADGGDAMRLPEPLATRSPISASRQQPRPPTASRPATISRSSTWQAGNARTSNASRRASSTAAWRCRSMPR